MSQSVRQPGTFQSLAIARPYDYNAPSLGSARSYDYNTQTFIGACILHTQGCCDHVSGIYPRLKAERHYSKGSCVKEDKAFGAST